MKKPKHKLNLLRTYTVKPIGNAKITDYDKTSRKRPAWIQIKNLPPKSTFVMLRVNNKLQYYRAYLGSRAMLYLPVDYTKEEMRKHYDKYSKIYEWHIKGKNNKAAKFMLKQIPRLAKDVKILDLGAGTGIVAEELVKAGYSNVTLLDFSAKMLAEAKKKKSLKACKFIRQDVKKLNPKNKYDLIISIFLFAGNTYFKEEEMPKLWKLVRKYLKPNGIIALYGYDYQPPAKLFKKIKAGIERKIVKHPTKYYIGKKK